MSVKLYMFDVVHFRQEDPRGKGSPASPSRGQPSPGDRYGRRPEPEQLKAKSESTLYRDPGKENLGSPPPQPSYYATKSYPNLDGADYPDNRRPEHRPR